MESTADTMLKFSRNFKIYIPVDKYQFKVNTKYITTWTQDIEWTYVRSSADILLAIGTPYVRSVYVLFQSGGTVTINTSPAPLKVALNKYLFTACLHHKSM